MIARQYNIFAHREEALQAIFMDYEVVRMVQPDGNEHILVKAPLLSHVEAHEVGLLGQARRYLLSFAMDRISLELADASPSYPLHTAKPDEMDTLILMTKIFTPELYFKMVTQIKPTWASHWTHHLGLWQLTSSEQDQVGAKWLSAKDQIRSVPGLVVVFVFEQPITN